MKHMKKVLALLLALIMVLPPVAGAVATREITLTSGTLQAGSKFVCAVSIANNKDAGGLSCADIVVDYDTAALKITTITNDYYEIDEETEKVGRFSGTFAANPASGEIGWASDVAMKRDGDLFWMVIETQDDVFNGDYTVTITKKPSLVSIFEGPEGVISDSDITIIPATITVTGGKDPAAYTPVVTQSTPATVTYGYQEAAQAMTVAATVAEGTLSYQWYADGSPVGTDSASYTPATTQCGTVTYTCKVTNEYSGHTFSATSDAFAVTVNPAALGDSDVALKDSSFLYTGDTITPELETELTAADYTLTGNVSAKNVGDYTLTVTGKGNYAGTVELDWSITPATITVTGGTASMTVYNNGNPFDITPFAAETVDGSDAAITYAVKSGSEFVTLDAEHLTLTGKGEVGSAVIEVTITAANHTTVVKTIEVTVQNKIDVSDKIAFADGSSVYDGKVKTHETATVTDPALTGTITYEYSGERKNAGTFTVTAVYEDATNYGEKTVTYTVQPATVTIGSAKVADKEYDGTDAATATVTLSGAAEGDTLVQGVDYTATAAFSDKNAGEDISAQVTVTMTNSNYVLSANTATEYANILRKTVTPTLTADDVTYTGEARTPATVTFAGTIGEDTLVEGTDYTVTYENNVNVGTAKVTVEAKSGRNYTFAKVETTFAIAPAPLTVTAAAVQDKTYDGTTAATVTAVTFSGVMGSDTVAYTATAVFADKNAGEGKAVNVTVELDESVKNYTLTSGTFTTAAAITPKPVTPTLTASNAVYTGSELKTGSVTFTGMVGTEEMVLDTDYTVKYENNVNAGTAKFIVETKDGSNYTFTKAEKTFEIAKAEVEIPAAVTGLTYNGSEKTGVILPANAKYTLEGNTATDSGDYTAKAILTDKANYKWQGKAGADESADVTIIWSIAKGTALTLTGEKSLRYNNTAVQSVALADLADGIKEIANASVNVSSGGEILNPSSVKVENGVLTYALADGLTEADDGKTALIIVTFDSKNYEKSSYQITVTAMKKVDVSSKIQFANGEYFYNGTDLTHETAKVTDDALKGTITYSYTGDRKNVGTFTVTAAYEDADNAGTATVTVTVKPVSLNVKNAEVADKTYDGTTDATITVTLDGMVNGETLTQGTDYTVEAAFADKNAGADKNVAYTVALNESVKNYVLESATGTVKADITPASVTVTVSTVDGTYNGTEQKTATVSFTGMVGEETMVEGADYTVTYANNKDAGTAKVTVEAKSGSNYTFVKAEETFEIAKITLTIGSVRPFNDKVYDGTTDGDVGVFLKGVLEGEEVDYTVEATFDNKNVGTNRIIDFTIVLAEGVKNYVVSPDHVTGRVGASILPKEVTPTMTAANVTYTGSAHTHGTVTFAGAVAGETLAEGTDFTVTYEANTNAGTAKYIVESKAGSNYTFEKAEKTFVIAKAKVTGEPAFTAITVADKTLGDAALTAGTLTPAGGTIVWDLGDATVAEANTEYAWTYTPADTANYEVRTGMLTPYVRYSKPVAGTVAGTIETGNTEAGGSAVTTKPAATATNGTASVVVSGADGKALLDAAVKNGADEVVIAPEIKGEADQVSVRVPTSTVEAIGKTGASVVIETPVAAIEVDAEDAKDLTDLGSTLTVTAEKTDKGVEITMQAAGKDVEVPVTVTVPAEDVKPGTVAVLVKEDGTRQIIRKTATAEDGLLVPVSGSAKIEIVDNAKTFTDVVAAEWYAKAVAFASSRELFQGVGSNKFQPSGKMTRAMLAQVLHNLENNPDHTAAGIFKDVVADEWYAEAVNWAAETGIINGYGNDKYGPMDNVSREQIVTMMWRYVGSPESKQALTDYSDASKVSAYAVPAIRWAVENGIVKGYTNSTLKPQGDATRAEVAEMFKNFVEYLAK